MTNNCHTGESLYCELHRIPLEINNLDSCNFGYFAFTLRPAGQAFIFVLPQKRNKKVKTEKAFTRILL
jgi:hypothetical protein